MPETPGLAIGVDLGATKIAAALISPDGQLLDSSLALTEASQGAEAVLDRITDQVSALLRRAAGPITGVGIGSPGQVNSHSGLSVTRSTLAGKKFIFRQRFKPG